MNLETHLESLERLFEGYHVDKEHAPSGLKSILGTSFDSNICHWVISKDKISNNSRGKSKSPKSIRKQPTKSMVQEDLDLTGSPLKCPFTLNEELDDEEEEFLLGSSHDNENEDIYVPMSPQEARSLLSKFNLQTQNATQATTTLPLISCIINGESIIALGALRKENAVSMYEVTYEGSKMIQDLISFDKLMSLHRSMISSSAKVDSFVTSEYNVISDHEDFSEIKLVFKWTKPKALLENPSVSADVGLDVSVRPGHEKLMSHENWEQLQLLKGLIAGINNQGITWRQRSESENGLKDDLLNLLERIKNLTPRSNQEFTDVSALVGAGGDIEEKICVITDNTRQDVDFTDLLWSTLYKVESYQELTFSLTMILKTLQTDEIRPFIYTRNDSKIARIVQNIVRGSKEPIPEMSGRLPLDILIEIGLEKLRRDYIHTLMTNDLTSQEDIKTLIVKCDNKVLEIENLLKLHYVIELVLLSHTFLSLSHNDLRSIVSQALKTLVKGSSPISWEEQKFYISLQSSQFRNQLLKMKPIAWMCRLKSSNAKETTCRFSIDPPMPYVASNLSHFKDSTDSEYSYYNSILSIITRSL